MTADIIITLLILYGLLRSKTGWAHTDKVSTIRLYDLGVRNFWTLPFHIGRCLTDQYYI